MPAFHVYLSTPDNPPTCAGTFTSETAACEQLDRLGIDLLPTDTNTWIGGEGEGAAIAAVAGCYARYPSYATALPLVLNGLIADHVWGSAGTVLWITVL